MTRKLIGQTEGKLSIGGMKISFELQHYQCNEDEPTPEPIIKQDNKPTQPRALWVASLFRRSAETSWTDKEIGAYVKHKALLTPENQALLASYYESERKRGDDGAHRRDLGTFLNNLPGEIDRAKAPKINGQTRNSPPAGPRSVGNANAGMSSQYGGIGRVAPASNGDKGPA